MLITALEFRKLVFITVWLFFLTILLHTQQHSRDSNEFFCVWALETHWSAYLLLFSFTKTLFLWGGGGGFNYFAVDQVWSFSCQCILSYLQCNCVHKYSNICRLKSELIDLFKHLFVLHSHYSSMNVYWTLRHTGRSIWYRYIGMAMSVAT